MKQKPPLLIWITVFLCFSGLSLAWVNTPAYHDAVLTFDKALQLKHNLYFPFITKLDPGHPPLVAWLLGSLWWLPIPKLWSMHLLCWAAASLFFTSIYQVGKQGWGWPVGLGAAVLSATNPVIFTQAQQLNLDIFLAAFSFLALSAAAEGKPRLLALACIGGVFSKLNGMFMLGPLLLVSFFGCIFSKKRKEFSYWISAFWPMLLALFLFVVYHAIKLSVTGHLFDDGSFEGGNQLRLVSDCSDYLRHLYHSLHQTLVGDNSVNLIGWFQSNLFNYSIVRGNGNLLVFVFLGLTIVVTAIAMLIPCVRSHITIAWFNNTEKPSPDNYFWKKRGAVFILTLLWLMLIVQLTFQSLRLVWTLVRYFIICYPVLYITFFAFWSLYFPKNKTWTLLAILPLLIFFLIKGHTQNNCFIPKVWEDRIIYPSPDTATNYENSPHLLSHLDATKRAIQYIINHTPYKVDIKTVWPYTFYVKDPNYGMLPFDANKDPVDSKLKTHAILTFSHHHFGKSPKEIRNNYPGYDLIKVYKNKFNWVAVFFKKTRTDL